MRDLPRSRRRTRVVPPVHVILPALVILSATLALAACDTHSPTGPGSLQSLSVLPGTATMAINGTQQFTAVGEDAEGAEVEVTPTWSIAEGGGAIDQNGRFTAGTTPGTYQATVQASADGRTATASVTVTVGPLAEIVVSPDPDTLAINGTRQFAAVGYDAAGNEVSITPTWSVEQGGGTIDGDGTFTAGTTPGTYKNTVQATSGGISGSATVTVVAGPVASISVAPSPDTLPINAERQFAAVGHDAAGNEVPITPTWSVEQGGGTIDSEGMFTAGSTSGTFTNTVQATSGGVSGHATVVVTTGPLASISITVIPNPVVLPINGTRQFSAEGRDSGGNLVPISPTWSVVAGGGGINSTGFFTAGTTTGTFTNTVRAAVDGISDNATVRVTAGPLESITVTPNPVALAPTETQQFTAVGRDSGGNTVVISPTWSVVAGGGTIDSGGEFTAGATSGTFNNTVRATSGGKSGHATVTVTAAPPPAPLVDLGAAGPNGIMAGTEVTCITGGTIFADVSIHPGSTITGFGPCVITGTQHLADAVAEQGQIDLTTAYNTLAGLPCPPANAIAADLGGTTVTPGVYCTGSGIGVTGTLTLDGQGDPNATFVFQAGSSLTTAGDVVLINGAQAKNVYWQVGSSATLGTASQWQGNILALTSITLNDNAILTGRALARNGAVTLGTNNVIILP